MHGAMVGYMVRGETAQRPAKKPNKLLLELQRPLE